MHGSHFNNACNFNFDIIIIVAAKHIVICLYIIIYVCTARILPMAFIFTQAIFLYYKYWCGRALARDSFGTSIPLMNSNAVAAVHLAD